MTEFATTPKSQEKQSVGFWTMNKHVCLVPWIQSNVAQVIKHESRVRVYNDSYRLLKILINQVVLENSFCGFHYTME